MKVIKSFASINFCGVSEASTLKNRLINKITSSDKMNMSEDKSEGNKSKDTKHQEIKTQEVKVRSNKSGNYDERGRYIGPEGITMKVNGVKPIVTFGSLFNKYARKSDFSKSNSELDDLKGRKQVRHSPTDPMFNAKATLATNSNACS